MTDSLIYHQVPCYGFYLYHSSIIIKLICMLGLLKQKPNGVGSNGSINKIFNIINPQLVLLSKQTPTLRDILMWHDIHVRPYYSHYLCWPGIPP